MKFVSLRRRPRGAPAIVSTPVGIGGRTFAALQYSQYRLLWFGMLASYLGMQMNIVTRGYLAYNLSGAAIALGLVNLTRALPQLMFTLVGGVVADQRERRKVLIVTQSMAGTVAVINAVLVLTGVIDVWHLAALGIVEGTILAFNMPARQAIIPELVPRDLIANAVALNGTGMNMTRVIGPSMAGAMIGMNFISIGGTFVFIAAMYVIVVGMLFRLRPTKIDRPAQAPGDSGLTSGLRYIARRPVLLTLISMAFVPILLGFPIQTLLPVFAADVLHVNAFGLGVMYTALGVGALVGSLAVAYLVNSPGKRQAQLLFGLGFGLSLLAFSFATYFPLAILLLLLVGFTSQGYLSLNSTMIMLSSEPHMYGRVMSVYMSTFALVPLSTLPVSVLVDSVGTAPAFGGAALLIILFMLYIQFFRSEYRRMPTDAVELGSPPA